MLSEIVLNVERDSVGCIALSTIDGRIELQLFSCILVVEQFHSLPPNKIPPTLLSHPIS